MNGRYYAKRVISANYVPENVLDSKVGTSAKLWGESNLLDRL